jgi:hypothetical protein
MLREVTYVVEHLHMYRCGNEAVKYSRCATEHDNHRLMSSSSTRL